MAIGGLLMAPNLIPNGRNVEERASIRKQRHGCVRRAWDLGRDERDAGEGRMRGLKGDQRTRVHKTFGKTLLKRRQIHCGKGSYCLVFLKYHNYNCGNCNEGNLQLSITIAVNSKKWEK